MNPDLIFDLGMHHGHDSEYYLKKGFQVVAVEANPLLCARATAGPGASPRSGNLPQDSNPPKRRRAVDSPAANG